jgi:hypothetical protein
MRRHFLTMVVVLAGMAVLAPGASASIAPALSLDQSAGTAAGSTTNLGLDLKFAPTGTDSPDHMTLSLPPGLLANASIDGGACLTMTDLDDAACQVGTGTVTAIAEGVVPITTPVTFDLVPPPAAGDLAGLAVNSSGTQIGATADIKVRPSGDPAGVGITITFVLPNTLDGVPISLTEISSTFDGLRYPATCPATPQTVGVAVNSYSDQTVHSLSAPLSVTNCAALPYSPKFSASATQDTGDRQVKLATNITQAANESPNNSVSLGLPVATLQPNLNAIGALCLNPASGTCTPVGSATATSPLYPKPLTGNAYLTGSLATGLTLTLVFPSPFPLTLTGKIDLAGNSTAFAGLPDIPLTDLNVTLDGGAHGLFKSNCANPSGTATASLTDQNGDKKASAPASFTVANCTASHGSGGTGSGSGSGSGSGGGNTGTSGPGGSPGPRLTKTKVTGLRSGHVALSFTVSESKRLAKMNALTVELPSGLSFARHRVGKRLRVTGISLKGAKVRSITLSHGHLVITLRKAVRTVTVQIKTLALKESAVLKAKAKAKKLKSLRLIVIAKNTKGKRTAIHVQVKQLGL